MFTMICEQCDAHFSQSNLFRNFSSSQGNIYTGGMLLDRLCSCLPTVELAVGKLKKNCN